MFHAAEGLYFQRQENGSVRVLFDRISAGLKPLEPGEIPDVEFDADAWASVVSSMSEKGEDAYSFHLARAFHGEPGIAVELPKPN